MKIPRSLSLVALVSTLGLGALVGAAAPASAVPCVSNPLTGSCKIVTNPFQGTNAGTCPVSTTGNPARATVVFTTIEFSVECNATAL